MRRLVAGVRAVADGDLGTRVDAHSNDEFGDLGVAFNDMSRSLQTKQELLDAEHTSHEQLLLSLMPENVAQRYRGGEETIAEDHEGVAVVVADIVGLDDYADGLSADQGVALLNEIMGSFDDAATGLGVVRVRSLRSEYVAVSGLRSPGGDAVRSAVDLTLEMAEIVARFDAAHAATLGLRAGIDVGTVTSGLVGRSNVIFDVWGDAVDAATRIHSAAQEPGISISPSVAAGLNGDDDDRLVVREL